MVEMKPMLLACKICDYAGTNICSECEDAQHCSLDAFKKMIGGNV